MTTIHTVTESALPASLVLSAAYDFSDRRAAVFPAVSLDFYEVHELGETWADVTKGTRAGVGFNWERCRYDWSQPGSVTATVTDSNVYAVPGSSWELRATPTDGGSRVEMIWAREFAHSARGAIFGTLYRLVGKPIFGDYARKVLDNLRQLEDGPSLRDVDGQQLL